MDSSMALPRQNWRRRRHPEQPHAAAGCADGPIASLFLVPLLCDGSKACSEPGSAKEAGEAPCCLPANGAAMLPQCTPAAVSQPASLAASDDADCGNDTQGLQRIIMGGPTGLHSSFASDTRKNNT